MNVSCARLLIIAVLGSSLTLLGCGSKAGSEGGSGGQVFLKAEPAVDAELEMSPGSLRVYLSQFPDVSTSSMSLVGPEGEIPLSGLHTMGADDLMIGIDRYPLSAGLYTVQWTTRFEEGGPEFNGSYNFSVKGAPQ